MLGAVSTTGLTSTEDKQVLLATQVVGIHMHVRTSKVPHI